MVICKQWFNGTFNGDGDVLLVHLQTTVLPRMYYGLYRFAECDWAEIKIKPIWSKSNANGNGRIHSGISRVSQSHNVSRLTQHS